MKAHQAILIVSLSLPLCACSTAKVATHRDVATPKQIQAAPTMVYVADFELDAATIKSERGLLPSAGNLPGPLAKLPMPGKAKDPEKLKRELVNAMSTTMIKDLAKAGLQTRRLAPGATMPTSGWLVRGTFTEVNQGNQMRRAVIGFGAGKTDLQVLAEVNDLAQGPPAPFYEVSTAADSGRMPGAGPMIAINPGAAAVRFVIAGKDLDKNVKHTAQKIAGEVVAKAKPVEVAVK